MCKVSVNVKDNESACLHSLPVPLFFPSFPLSLSYTSVFLPQSALCYVRRVNCSFIRYLAQCRTYSCHVFKYISKGVTHAPPIINRLLLVHIYEFSISRIIAPYSFNPTQSCTDTVPTFKCAVRQSEYSCPSFSF